MISFLGSCLHTLKSKLYHKKTTTSRSLFQTELREQSSYLSDPLYNDGQVAWWHDGMSTDWLCAYFWRRHFHWVHRCICRGNTERRAKQKEFTIIDFFKYKNSTWGPVLSYHIQTLGNHFGNKFLNQQRKQSPLRRIIETDHFQQRTNNRRNLFKSE